ncbi:sodium:calcium antiporter [Halorarum halophilum]|uniref:Sodium:calcium antiporter n=1 Tax=Halorarum halophilum TaxID=2743090 RepID=A0A7D5L2J0_9EURY|nr:sodium:calcium antiporter [Halobaculum halophilum]QLG26123.1 sodium:calcium antiporter [Halobaculum halophilum]
MGRFRHPLVALALVVALTLPWVVLRSVGVVTSLSTMAIIATSGVAVLGAAFVLTWAAETAETDVPRAFALAVLAVIAVAPEYAVDALYAWEAGAAPGTPASETAANLAVANMTGANRILIGLGWAGIALYAIHRATRSGGDAVVNREGFLADAVELEPRISIEIVFLAIATVYAFVIPLNGGIDVIDAAFLVGLYVVYIYVIFQGEAGEEVHLGVPGYFQKLTRPRRVGAILIMFAYSAIVILIAVKPFAKGLEVLGPRLGVSSFFMIQWVAPLASESPEFIATAYLVRKARTTASFNALISSKLNQWTLLIGTLVLVYSLSLGYYDMLSFSQKQAGEIWLTAAQSFFAVTLLLNFEISIREALALLGLFLAQFYPAFQRYEGLLLYSAFYVVLGLGILVLRRRHLPRVAASVRRYAFGTDAQSTMTD